MKNAFETHGVEYLSPSSINKFRRDPAKWLVNIAGYKDTAYSPAMTFGIIIEDGLTHACMLPNIPTEDAIQFAMDKYTEKQKEIHDSGADYDFDKCFQRGKLIPKTLNTIIPIYRKLGALQEAQVKVEFTFDDVGIPIIGYVDYMYDNFLRDLKTTGVYPKIRSDYGRQLAFYALATGKKPFIDFAYVTTTKQELVSYPVSSLDSYIKELKFIALRMKKLLEFSSDIHEVCNMSCLIPDTTNEDFMKQWGKNEIKGANILFKENV